MIYIMPINVNELDQITKPFSVFKNDKIEVSFCDFEINDKEEMLNIENLAKTPEGKWNYLKKTKIYYHLTDNEIRNILDKNYYYKIECDLPFKQFHNGDILSAIKYLEGLNLTKLNLGFNVYFGKNNYYGIITKRRESNISNYISDINISKLTEIKSLFMLIFLNVHANKKKLDLILELLGTSYNSGIPKALSNSLKVTILENMFSDKSDKQEIKYRFSMRLTKFYNGVYEDDYKKVKKLYDARSSYYHTGIDTFELSDDLVLNKYIDKTLSSYITDPNSLNGDNLDRLLLKN